jgi:hypothetical protein
MRRVPLCRLIADCRLAANSSPTETDANARGARVFVKNSVGSFRLTLPTYRLKITQCFQTLPSVGSRQFTPPSYGGVLTPPSQMAAVSVPSETNTAEERQHA